ncbi:MAG TPA: diacylglycerol kinase family protein [Rhizomicrobium sp.]
MANPQKPEPAPVDLGALRISALLNRSSGGCDADTQAQFDGILAEARIAPVEVRCVEGAELDEALAQLVGSGIDVLIALGGDGTLRAAAEKCGAAGISLIALPGGTMNMMSKALYGARDWREALRQTLADPRLVAVSGGEVEGKRFFCAGIFGSPSLWAGAREAVRKSHFLEAGRRAMFAFHATLSGKVTYRFGANGSGSSAAVAVICPLVSAALASNEPGLEAVALDPKGSREALRLAWNALCADWRADASVSRATTKLARISARGRIPSILDGEAIRLPRTAEIRFVPHGFNALVPSSGMVG